jgi:hypothetical protein
MRRIVAFFCVLGPLLALVAFGSPSQAASAPVTLGMYDGNHSPAGIETAASWLGSPSDIAYAEDFLDDTSWSTISDPSWFTSQWQGSPYTMVWGVPMVPCGAPSTQCAANATEFDAVAAGTDDSYYTTLAQNLVASGFGSSYIRLGWEFQGGWFPWTICNADGQQDFVAAFRNIVTSMRAASGENFKFIWNPDDSDDTSCAGQLESYYPGDSYVDAVGLDAYDETGGTVTDSERWTEILDGVNAGGWTETTPQPINGQSFEGYGLNWLAAFAAEHGKQTVLPEWGLWSSSGTNDGGGDDPYFINEMAAWIKANATGPAIFWNGDSSDVTNLTIPGESTGQVPNSTAAFQSDFGPSAPTVTVPSVIGRTDLDTAEGIITSAGLVAAANGNSGVGNLGSVTAESPAAGSLVAPGSTVTITYTIPSVTVPSVIGRTDLDTAEGIITSAGLVAVAKGDSGVGNKGSVTAESPAGGSSVLKGSTVTITYTVP